MFDMTSNYRIEDSLEQHDIQQLAIKHYYYNYYYSTKPRSKDDQMAIGNHVQPPNFQNVVYGFGENYLASRVISFMNV